MIAQNRKMKKEEKKRASKVNALKKSARITKRGRSFTELLGAADKLPSGTKTSEDPIEPLLQVLLSLSTNTINDSFYHLDRKIGELSNQNKWMVAAYIVWKWGWGIVGSSACVL